MSIRLGAVVVNVQDVERASAFWTTALGVRSSARDPAFLVSPDGTGPELHLDADDASHLDLWTIASDDLDSEVRRLLAIGATRPDWEYPPDADFVVLRDTEGNLFCLVAAVSPTVAGG